MSEKTKTLFGLPIVESEQLTTGTAIIGRLPTLDELIESGLTLEQWLTKHAKEFRLITGLDESE